jgi:Uma2 family endonuclease
VLIVGGGAVVAGWPEGLLSLVEWDAIPPDPRHRYELVEGVLVVVPRPATFHASAVLELGCQLRDQLPRDLIVLPEVEVLIDGAPPPSVRVPDVVVARRSVAKQNPVRLNACDVLLAVEVLSPGTVRTDTVTKPAEYAEAGIGAYWVLDPTPPTSLSAYVLVDGEYEVAAQGSGRLHLLSPVPVELDLERLLP